MYLPRVGSSCEDASPALAEYSNSFFWNNNRGAETVLSGLIHFNNLTAVGNVRAGLSAMESALPVWPGLTFKNSLIVARLDSQSCLGSKSKSTVGIETPWKRGSFTAQNITFVNFDHEHCVAVDPCYKAYKNDCGNTGKFEETKFINSSNRKIE